MKFNQLTPVTFLNDSGEDIPPFSIISVQSVAFRGANKESLYYVAEQIQNVPGIWLTTGPVTTKSGAYSSAYTGHYVPVAYSGDPEDLQLGDIVGGQPGAWDFYQPGLGGYKFIGKCSDEFDQPIILVERLTNWMLRGILDGDLDAPANIITPTTATVSIWSDTADTGVNVVVTNDDPDLEAETGSLVRVVPDGRVWTLAAVSCGAVETGV